MVELFLFSQMLGSKVCFEETKDLTKKVREALKKESPDGTQDTKTTSNSGSGSDSSSSSASDQSSNTKESHDESVKKRDKV